jgi:streptogramin lyase
MLPPAWPKRIPEDQQASLSKEFPANPNRDLVAEKCVSCHTSDRIVAYRPEREEWEHTVSRMRMRMVSAGIPDMTDEETNKVLDYLSVSFPPIQPYDANSRLPTTLLQGKALKYRAVTLDLPDDFVEPHDVATDPQGYAWVADHAGTKLGRFDSRTFEFIEKPLPAGSAPPNRQSMGNPQIDSRGVLWVSDGPNGRWLSYDTKTDTPVVFQWPKTLGGGAGGNSMAVNPNGTIWATGANRGVRVLDPQTKQFRSYESPSAKGSQPPGAYGLAVAGDGSIWWAEDAIDKVARLDPVTEKVEEFKIPYEGRAFPRRMNVDGNGDLWVGLWFASKLMKIDHKTKEMKIYTPPSLNGGHYSVVVDKKGGYVWVSEQQVDKIARFDPRTEEWTEYPLPDAESDPRRIDVDPLNPNRVYFSGDSARRLGFVEVLP